jgi:hypothetical protein
MVARAVGAGNARAIVLCGQGVTQIRISIKASTVRASQVNEGRRMRLCCLLGHLLETAAGRVTVSRLSLSEANLM